MNSVLLINSIYLATEGEGSLIGRPQIFVRTQGCNIGCLNCDSKDTWEFNDKTATTVDDVLRKIKDLSKGKLKRVSITGGDPLHPKMVPGVLQLIRELKSLNYFISLEAAGTRLVHEIFDLVDFVNFDLKTPSTGVVTNFQLILQLAEQYPQKFQIKSVAQDEKDFAYVYANYENVITGLKARNLLKGHALPFDWCVTPVYNTAEEFPLERFKLILKLNEEAGGPFRVIGQQHKWVFGPNEKQV